MNLWLRTAETNYMLKVSELRRRREKQETGYLGRRRGN